MIRFFIVIAFFLYSVCVNAQNSYRQKLYAYKEVHRSTSSLTNDTTRTNANGSYANYLIYVELPKSDTPIWNTAVIGNDIYAVHSTLVEESSMVVGERKRDHRLIKIRPEPSNNLWKLEFDMTGEKDASTTNVSEETVVLKGIFKNRNISSTVRGIVELTSP